MSSSASARRARCWPQRSSGAISAANRAGSTRSHAAQIPAAITGAAMSTYTGALLAATSIPLWAALPKLLPASFGASAMASAAAALSLGAAGSKGETLRRVELVASAVELTLVAMLSSRLRGHGIKTRISVAPVLAAAATPLIESGVHAFFGRNRRTRKPGTLGAVVVLAGAFLLRHLVLRAGNESAKRPRDHFRFSRP